MTSRTHDIASFTALNIIVATQPIPHLSLATFLTATCMCFIGGLMPDIDDSTSEFWHKLPAGTFLGRLFHPFIGGHRLISHSLLGLIIVGFVMKYLFILASKTILVDMNNVWLAFMIGYATHLIMDVLTTEGIPLLFPIPIHFGFLPIKMLRIKTGGLIEKFLVFPSLFFFNIYLFFNYYPIYLRLLKMLINKT